MLLEKIALKNVLSFKDSVIDLRPLNVLIGENTAGKSNLIEAIGLMQAAPDDLSTAILRSGGIRSWLWLGDGIPAPLGEISCSCRIGAPDEPLLWEIKFTEIPSGPMITREALKGSSGKFYFQRDHHEVRLPEHTFQIGPFSSVLESMRNPTDPTPTTKLSQAFRKIRIYREFQTGPRSATRFGVATTAQNLFLEERGDNLALVLLELDYRGVRDKIREYLNRFSDRITDIRVRVDQGVAQVHLMESGLMQTLSSVRMSDGTLKFLCLLAVLLHPDPPPLVCIEEPEQGLHPDAIHIVAQLLREASERMQLIVTTHSRTLVDEFTDTPDSVLVCGRDFDGGTQCERLSPERLEEWLSTYTLGDLWTKGEIGGNPG